jgi:carboxylesterase type B
LYLGSAHGTEFLYLFGPTLMLKLGGRRFTMDEDRFSKRVRRHWADFIRQGQAICACAENSLITSDKIK